MKYQTYYPEVTQKQIDDHAAWYESIVIVDENGNPEPLTLLPDPDQGEDGDTDIFEEE